VQEAVALSGVAGKTSHITMASYKSFGDPFQHERRTASTTLASVAATPALNRLKPELDWI